MYSCKKEKNVFFDDSEKQHVFYCRCMNIYIYI